MSYFGGKSMGVFRRLLRSHSTTTNAESATASVPHAPLDGSTVRTNLRDQIADPGAGSAGEERAHYIVVLEGIARGRSIQLGATPVTVGRTAPADLVLPDERVSRSHCSFHVLLNEVIVTDLNSTNGSFVDGKRISGTLSLRPGGALQVGQHMLRHKFWSQRELEEWQRLQGHEEPLAHATSDIRIEIDETKRRQEVQQITDSLYFRDLSVELDEMRDPDDK